MARKIALWIEFTGFFILLPFILFIYRENLKRLIIPLLLAGFIVFLILLIRDTQFDHRKLWLPDGFVSHLKPILIRLIAGGILFAWTYHRSGSILFSSIEHGLWGDFIFTVGLGMYFYSGAV